MDNSKPERITQYVEIDIASLLAKLWEKRWSVVKITCCFIVLGVVVALITPRKYTATRVFITQSNSSAGSAGSLSSLASLAGINLGSDMQDGPMSPLVYPHLLTNVEFQKELMMTPVHFDGIDHEVTLYDYYTDPQYSKHPFLSKVEKYTIGLPGTLREKRNGENPVNIDSLKDEIISGSRIQRLTQKEIRVAKMLRARVSIAINKKEGYITISSTMPEAIAAAQLNESLFNLLRKYVSEFKVNKSQQYLDYIQMEHDQVKAEYEDAQIRYATFRDANRGSKTAVAEVEANRLESEMTLTQQLYTSLANNLLAAKVKVKEENVVFTDISPVSVPDRPVNSRKKTVMTWTLIGFLLACGWIVAREVFLEQKDKLKKA